MMHKIKIYINCTHTYKLRINDSMLTILDVYKNLVNNFAR